MWGNERIMSYPVDDDDDDDDDDEHGDEHGDDEDI